MKKIPFIRQGQNFDYTILNTIIEAINQLSIDRPDYDDMMNDLATINNQYTTRIDSFIERYRDVVENTPTLLELLKAYADLKEKCDGTPTVQYEISSLNLDFVKNPDPIYKGLFPILGELPVIPPDVIIEKGKAIIAASEFNEEGDPINGSSSVFIQCADVVTNPNYSYSWLCLDTIVGPEGNVGPQGPQGPKGDKGADGKDGNIVNIRGSIGAAASEDEIKNVLNSIVNTVSNLKNNDGYISDNEEIPCIYVYTPNSDYQDPVYAPWTVMRNIRGPQGPKGKGTSVHLAFATSASESETPTPADQISINDMDNYYYLCIALTEEGQAISYDTRVRFRQPNQKFKAKTAWSYLSDDTGELSVYEEPDNTSSITIGEGVLNETTIEETREMKFSFPDPPTIKNVEITDDGKLRFTFEYSHIPAELKPKPIIIETPTASINKFFDETIDQTSSNAVQNKAVAKALDGYVPQEGGKIPISYFPDSVGKFVSGKFVSENEFQDENGKPVQGETGTTYIDKETGKTYGYSGAKFVIVTGNLTLGIVNGTAYDGGKGQEHETFIKSIRDDHAPVQNATNSVNAANATNAINDGQGRNIADTYATQQSLLNTTNSVNKNSQDIKQINSKIPSFANSKTVTDALSNKADSTDLKKVEITANAAATKIELERGLKTKQNTGDYATRTELSEGLQTKQDAGEYATVLELTEGLAEKQPKGSYATTSELTNGLSGKQNQSSDLLETKSKQVVGAINEVNKKNISFKKIENGSLVSKNTLFVIECVVTRSHGLKEQRQTFPFFYADDTHSSTGSYGETITMDLPRGGKVDFTATINTEWDAINVTYDMASNPPEAYLAFVFCEIWELSLE